MIHVVIAGNIGKDAEVRSAGQSNVCSFNVASSRKDGRTGQEQTTWLRCSLWGKRGESLAQYLKKGTPVTVIGEMSTEEYQGKTQLNVRVDDVKLQGGARAARGDAYEAPGGDSSFAPDISSPFAGAR